MSSIRGSVTTYQDDIKNNTIDITPFSDVFKNMVQLIENKNLQPYLSSNHTISRENIEASKMTRTDMNDLAYVVQISLPLLNKTPYNGNKNKWLMDTLNTFYAKFYQNRDSIYTPAINMSYSEVAKNMSIAQSSMPDNSNNSIAEKRYIENGVDKNGVDMAGEMPVRISANTGVLIGATDTSLQEKSIRVCFDSSNRDSTNDLQNIVIEPTISNSIITNNTQIIYYTIYLRNFAWNVGFSGTVSTVGSINLPLVNTYNKIKSIAMSKFLLPKDNILIPTANSNPFIYLYMGGIPVSTVWYNTAIGNYHFMFDLDGDDNTVRYSCIPLNKYKEVYDFSGNHVGFPNKFVFTFADANGDIINIPTDRLSMFVVSYDKFGDPTTQNTWITLQTSMVDGKNISHTAITGDTVTINNFMVNFSTPQIQQIIDGLSSKKYNISYNNNPSQFAIQFPTDLLLRLSPNGLIPQLSINVLIRSKTIFFDSTINFY